MTMSVLAIVLVVHGLIHLLGVAKAFGADLLQLAQPISPVFGVLWLVATVLCLAAATSLFVWPRGWWMVGACALLVSDGPSALRSSPGCTCRRPLAGAS